MPPASTVVLVIGVLTAYVVLCRRLRYNREKAILAKYGYRSRSDLKRMTNTEAYEIQDQLYSREMPWTVLKGLQFALFKTYGIPTISNLLVQTKQLSEGQHASKRYADTELLVSEFTSWHPEAERTNQAISRMNVIHSMYQKAGLISNDDMLYTLALFASEPRWFCNKYEWRQWNDVETCAQGVFWKSIGDAMNISYEPLPSYKAGWTDGLHWFEEVDAWAKAYEASHMKPDPDNKITADETTNVFLWDVPVKYRPYGRLAVSALLTDRVRKAMMFEDPPTWLPGMIDMVFDIRKFFLRNFFLPRPDFLAAQYLDKEPNKYGRYNRKDFVSEPWYIAPTFGYRNDLNAWIKWLQGKPLPGDDERFEPKGYLIPEVGPKSMKGKGMKEFEEGYARLMAQKRGGCPFAFSS